MGRPWGETGAVCLAAWLVLAVAHAPGQIGGQVPANGTFVLDNVEDLNLNAGGVQRDWIFSYGPTLQATAPNGLTLAAGQSPLGVLRFSIAPEFGYIDESFGVPMPAVDGASTLAHPGNISGFERLEFFARSSRAITNSITTVILESYPAVSEGVYPKLVWRYNIQNGTTFRKHSLLLHAPTDMKDTGGRTVEQLLSSTRFLSFYFYGEGGGPYTVHVDDVVLVPPENSSVEGWYLFDD